MKDFKRHTPLPKHQQGIVLLITLLALVAMTLASVGMMRSVDTSVMAVGNMAFRQAADACVISAVEDTLNKMWDWVAHLNENDNYLNVDGAGNCYYASIQPGEDAQGIPARLQTASGTGVCSSADLCAGYTTRTMIERMCSQEGEFSEKSCYSASWGDKGGRGWGPTGSNELLAELVTAEIQGQIALHRVSVRVDGPKGTVSFAQAIVGL
jgi:hypothetical protein